MIPIRPMGYDIRHTPYVARHMAYGATLVCVCVAAAPVCDMATSSPTHHRRWVEAVVCVHTHAHTRARAPRWGLALSGEAEEA
jgi:hypothetical protein